MIVLVTTSAGLARAVVAMLAYQYGRRSARIRWPNALLGELRDHKLRCVGEPPQRVALEIDLLCESDDAHAGRLLS